MYENIVDGVTFDISGHPDELHHFRDFKLSGKHGVNLVSDGMERAVRGGFHVADRHFQTLWIGELGTEHGAVSAVTDQQVEVFPVPVYDRDSFAEQYLFKRFRIFPVKRDFHFAGLLN